MYIISCICVFWQINDDDDDDNDDDDGFSTYYSCAVLLQHYSYSNTFS